MSSYEDDKKPANKPYFRTVKEYSSSSTTHGIAYVFEDNRWIFERVIWIIVVIVAICIGVSLSISAYVDWQANPVLTSVGTTGYPIEKVEFPSITICAQGSSKEVVDAALFRQFDGYLKSNDKTFSELQYKEIVQWGHSFLEDKYPGARFPPNPLVNMMSSPYADAEINFKANAIFNPQPPTNCQQITNEVTTTTSSSTKTNNKRRRKRGSTGCVGQ